jgi:DNA-binding transcriptional MocR family regulator
MSNDSSVAILAGSLRAEAARLRPGDQLPSSRALMERHRVSPVTVSRAIALLAAEGHVVTRPGSGTFVADRRAHGTEPADLSWQSVALGDRSVESDGLLRLLTPPPAGVIPLVGGYLSTDLQPLRALAAAAARAARRPGAWAVPPPAGMPELRAWFAGLVGAEPGDVLIANGGQAALTAVLRALLAPGAPLLVESPTYLGALIAARTAGFQPVPVPMDADGVRPDLLAEAFAATGARAFYTQPTFHNPTSAVMPPERRSQVLAAARAAGAFVIEDDFARHLAISPPPPPLVTGDRDGTVVHIASLTKATAPSLRIAGVIARGPVAQRLRATQLVESYFPARPLQETALELVSAPAWARHLRAVSAELRRRRDALVAAVTRELPQATLTSVPQGGLHLWIRIPQHLDDVEVTEAARLRGVLVGAGRPYFPAEPPAPHLRLSYSTPATAEEFTAGVRRLAEVLS